MGQSAIDLPGLFAVNRVVELFAMDLVSKSGMDPDMDLYVNLSSWSDMYISRESVPCEPALRLIDSFS